MYFAALFGVVKYNLNRCNQFRTIALDVERPLSDIRSWFSPAASSLLRMVVLTFVISSIVFLISVFLLPPTDYR